LHYLSASKEGVDRIDLNGDVDGKVTRDQAAYSISRRHWLIEQRLRRARRAREAKEDAKRSEELAALRAPGKARRKGGES
jgi:sRNA-binding protein